MTIFSLLSQFAFVVRIPTEFIQEDLSIQDFIDDTLGESNDNVADGGEHLPSAGYHKNDNDADSDHIEDSASASASSLLLSVPFYIYAELDWIAQNATVGNSIGNYSLLEFQELVATDHRNPKHDDDILFYISATKHPMRTHNPQDAKLFVVPTLGSLMVFPEVYKDPQDWKLCWNEMCARDLMVYTDEVLKNSSWFQRSSGSDHIGITNTFHWRHQDFNGKRFKSLERCNLIQFGEPLGKAFNSTDRLYFKAMYVGTGCDVAAEKKTHDLAMVAQIKPKDKRFNDRGNICKWSRAANYSMAICGEGNQCPTLADARLGFHAQGDTKGANRLFDTLLSGTVPIFTLPFHYEIHQEWIDWHKISYFAGLQNSSSFHDSMESILMDEEGIKEKTRMILANRDLFDWYTLVPFDTYMYMLQAYLWPETRTHISRYSALILPAPVDKAIGACNTTCCLEFDYPFNSFSCWADKECQCDKIRALDTEMGSK